MASFGTSPGEGGFHAVARPSLPGLGWSEGFATFFSSLARSSDIYFDKQGGGFFWMDIRNMLYPFEGEFYPFFFVPRADAPGYPDPDDPLLQQLDENAIAGMCYSMAVAIGSPQPTPTLAAQGQLFMDALRSPRMNVVRLDPAKRFPRGYVRHVWDIDEFYFPTNIRPLPYYSAPMFADYLDGLRCLPGSYGSFDLDAVIDAQILDYPYPTDEPPICQPRPDAPLTMTLSGPDRVMAGRDIVLKLEIRRPVPTAARMTLQLDLPPGVSFVGKAREVIVDATHQLITRTYRLRVARVPKQDVTLTLDSQTPTWGVHAAADYRFGRAAPARAEPRQGATMYGPGGRLIGRPIHVR